MKDQIEEAIDQLLEKAIRPDSLMRAVIGFIEPLGYQVVDRERTEGALKAWMDPEEGVKIDLKKITAQLKNQWPTISYGRDDVFGDEEIKGPGFTVSRGDIENDPHSIFIVVPAGLRKTEYEMGLDV